MGEHKGLLSIPGSAEPIVEALVRRGREAGFEPVLVGDAPWEPMLARYDAVRLADPLAEAISRGETSFQKLFASIEVEALPLREAVERALEDWDRPEDLVL